MSKLRQSAKGQSCTLQLPCCNHNCETTILAHIRLGFNAGMGQKPNDLHALFACSDCHDFIDNRTKGEIDYKDILRGHLRTLDIWVKMGLVVVPSMKNNNWDF